MARQMRNSKSVLPSAATFSLLFLLLVGDVPLALTGCGCCCGNNDLDTLSTLAGLQALARLPGVGSRLRRSAVDESPQPQRVVVAVGCNCGDETKGTTPPPEQPRPTRQLSAFLPDGYSQSSVKEAGRNNAETEDHTAVSRDHPIHFTPLDPSGGQSDLTVGRQQQYPTDRVTVGEQVFSSARFRREFSARNVFSN